MLKVEKSAGSTRINKSKRSLRNSADNLDKLITTEVFGEPTSKPWETQSRPPAALPTQEAFLVLEDEKTCESVEVLLACTAICDPNERGCPLLFTSKGYEQLVGSNKEQLAGRPCLQDVSTSGGAEASLADALQGKAHLSVEVACAKSDGSRFQDIVSVVPHLDRMGNLMHQILVHGEVDAKGVDLATGEEAHISHRQDLVGSLISAIFVTGGSSDAPIVNTSPGFQELLGYGDSDVQGMCCLCVCGPETDKKAMKAAITAQRAGQAGATKLLCYRKDGTPFWGELFNFPLGAPPSADDMDSPAPAQLQQQHLCILVDVTSNKQKRIGRYAMGKVIGKGAFGIVRLGQNTATGEKVAIKTIDASSFRSIAQIEQVQDEINVLSGLKHPNIIRLLDMHFAANIFYFVMEFASGGSLIEYVRKQEGHRLQEAEAKRIFEQVIDAVDYCHRRRVIHRDLKPENILLDDSGNVKVADFGLAGITTPFSGNLRSACGTPEFTAPEIVRGKEYDGSSVDIWSLGVILYELMQGHLPFKAPTQSGLFKSIVAGTYAPLPEAASPECRNLVAKMLTGNAEKRITMDEIRRHPWLLGTSAEEMRLLGRSMSISGGTLGRTGSLPTHLQSSLHLVIPDTFKAVSSSVSSSWSPQDDEQDAPRYILPVRDEDSSAGAEPAAPVLEMPPRHLNKQSSNKGRRKSLDSQRPRAQSGASLEAEGAPLVPRSPASFSRPAAGEPAKAAKSAGSSTGERRS
ncbi:hypothetical protein WJX72_006892 [[Myrmecia] bisecta]|uniref:Protein kinase domain-containing protein n=1 Tax=[Myrmecia] bisecta TaxID=41462 RepID=A0AAW1Q464_9CHLO